MAVEMAAAPVSGEVIATGTIIALGYSPNLINKVAKETHDSAEITFFGIPGDYHYGETRWSNSQGREIPNKRPITICGVEATRDACAKLGIADVPPGGLGENLLLEGAGDLSYVQPGDQVRVLDANGEIIAAMLAWSQNDPCANLKIYDRMMVKELYGKRGLLCTVLQQGTVRVGDRVEIFRPDAAPVDAL